MVSSCLLSYRSVYLQRLTSSPSYSDLSLVKHWRPQGIHTVVYLDDGFDVESIKLSSEIYSSIIRSDLALACFLANEDKSVWDLVRLNTWLGIVWNGL